MKTPHLRERHRRASDWMVTLVSLELLAWCFPTGLYFLQSGTGLGLNTCLLMWSRRRQSFAHLVPPGRQEEEAIEAGRRRKHDMISFQDFYASNSIWKKKKKIQHLDCKHWIIMFYLTQVNCKCSLSLLKRFLEICDWLELNAHGSYQDCLEQ